MSTAAPAPLVDEALAADLADASLTLARRFAAGATLWCLAPAWEPHAHHVAVEFVHPVVVGKRALPAVALTGPDLVPSVRISVRPGDVVLAVAAADDSAVASVMRRAPAWGVTTLWIGNGERPRRAPPITYCGSTTRPRACLRPAGSSCSTTCCGSSPTSASSTPDCSRRRRTAPTRCA
ncbi:hypothetical protein ACFQV8_00520 [Pseudonocardia benzenivorans]